MSKKINPHHFNIDLNSSQNNLSFVNQAQKSKRSQIGQNNNSQNKKLRFLSIILSSVFHKRMVHVFNKIKYKPLRLLQIKTRFVQVFLKLVKTSQFNNKFSAFQSIKKYYILKRKENLQILSALFQKNKSSAIRILNIFIKSKQKSNLTTAWNKINKFSKQKALLINTSFRKGFRKLILTKNKIVRRYFFIIRNSRFLIQRRLKINNISKIVKQIRNRSYKVGVDKLRRNMYKLREQEIKSEIKVIDYRIQTQQDQELKSLKQKQLQMKKNLIEIQKQKQLINEAYQLEVKQAQTKNTQIQSKILQLKQQNKNIQSQISQIQQKLNEQYTLNQIYEMFYNNFLLYLTKNKTKQLTKSELLDSLTKPLIPVEIPIQKLKQQNKIMRDLISEYVLIFGQKTLQGKQLQVPYQYLVKQNQTMYKMLLTLLPNLSYNKKDVIDLKQNLDAVESVVKQFKK